MLALYHRLYSLEDLWTVHKYLCKTEVVGKLLNIFRHQKLHSLIVWLRQTSDLQNLHIVSEDITSHLVGTNIDNLDVWVFARSKNSADLSVFTLQKLLHAHAFDFIDRERVYVDLYSPLQFNRWPFLFELFHHLSPNKHVIVVLFLDLCFGLLLKLEKTVRLLDHGGFLNQKSQISVSNSCFVHSPVLLNHYCCLNRPLVALKHKGRDSNALAHFILVIYAVEKLIISWLVGHIDFPSVAKLCYFPTIYVSHLDARVL